jgi:transcriptional regulator with XRE-family HTH domain
MLYGIIMQNKSKRDSAQTAKQAQAATTYDAVVGQILTILRKQQGIEQTAIADRLGIAQSTWSRIERGGSAITVGQLDAVAPLLRIPPPEVMQRVELAIHHLEQRGITVRRAGAEKATGQMAALGIFALSMLVIAALSSSR